MPWRDLLRVCRRLELAGAVRGGRFVQGGRVDGEQYALPEAVGLLRAARRDLKDTSKSQELVCVAAADPLNLLGIILPGERLPAVPGNRVLLRAGAVVALLRAGEVEHVGEPSPEQAWANAGALLRGAHQRRPAVA